MDRHQFGSASWIAALHGAIRDLLRDQPLPDRSYCFSERYTDAPADLGAAPIGWHVRVHRGQLLLGGAPDDAADCTIVADYQVAWALAQPAAEGGSAATREVARRAAAEGRLRLIGGPFPHEVLPALRALHARVSAITAPLVPGGPSQSVQERT